MELFFFLHFFFLCSSYSLQQRINFVFVFVIKMFFFSAPSHLNIHIFITQCSHLLRDSVKESIFLWETKCWGSCMLRGINASAYNISSFVIWPKLAKIWNLNKTLKIALCMWVFVWAVVMWAGVIVWNWRVVCLKLADS